MYIFLLKTVICVVSELQVVASSQMQCMSSRTFQMVTAGYVKKKECQVLRENSAIENNEPYAR